LEKLIYLDALLSNPQRMSLRNIDIGVLRSFLLIAEGRSFAQAAALVGRSPSAVTLQIQRLEQDLGTQLLRRSNREVGLTLAGERLLGFARRLVQTNDEAVLAFRAGGEAKPLRFGATQDLADAILPDVLRRFSLERPEVELTLRVDRSTNLIEAVKTGEIDAAIAVRRDDPLNRVLLAEMPMVWIGQDGMNLPSDRPVPLVLFDAPCSFRSAAIDALAAAGRPYRMALTSPSLTGLRSAAAVGLGITVRTGLLLGPGLADVGAGLGLPVLPEAALSLYVNPESDPSPAREDFIALCRQAFQAVL
jgi:DNA-binding transcriptional LysR family regulator